MQKNMNKIIVCSMYRSGGTLLFNILKEVVAKNNLPFSVGKRHLNWNDNKKKWIGVDEVFEEDSMLFYSYRNVDDVVTSYCKRERITNENDFKKLVGGKSEEQFKEWILDQDRRVKPYAISFCYETEIDGKELELQNKIEDIFNVERSNESKFLRSELKKFTDCLTSLDNETQFWPNHIS